MLTGILPRLRQSCQAMIDAKHHSVHIFAGDESGDCTRLVTIVLWQFCRDSAAPASSGAKSPGERSSIVHRPALTHQPSTGTCMTLTGYSGTTRPPQAADAPIPTDGPCQRPVGSHGVPCRHRAGNSINP